MERLNSQNEDLPVLNIIHVRNREIIPAGMKSKSQQRYEMSLDGFEHTTKSLFIDSVKSFLPEIQYSQFDTDLKGDDVSQIINQVTRPPFKHVTIVLLYYATSWRRYTSISVRSLNGYRFSGMALYAAWAIYLPGEKEPIKSAEIKKAFPPRDPHWEGSKNPERVIADIVRTEIENSIKNDWGLLDNLDKPHL